MANNIDYDSPHMCPVYGEIIDPDLCYDSLMCLGRMFKVESLLELARVQDIEKARKQCEECAYSKL